MASIGTILPSQNSDTVAQSSNKSSAAAISGSGALANESTFLQLLVSQLKNQNPMNPMDGTTFVTQLAQFSDLEQNLAMRQDLDTLTTKYAPSAPSTSQPSSDTGSNNSSGGSGATGTLGQ